MNVGDLVVPICNMTLVGGEQIKAGERFRVVRVYQTTGGQRLCLRNMDLCIPCIRPRDVALEDTA